MQKSQYIITLADPSQFPGLFKGPCLKGHREPRLAMVGRSNVGKSTLINALLKAPLAQTSNRPGKTRAIHFYLWGGVRKIIADLPGYGYAKISKDERQKWETLISSYFEHDEQLEQALVLLDARHGPTPADCEAIEFLSLKRIPVTLIFTKADTLKTQSERSSRIKEAAILLEKLGVDAKDVFWVSSHDPEEIIKTSENRGGLKKLTEFLSKNSP